MPTGSQPSSFISHMYNKLKNTYTVLLNITYTYECSPWLIPSLLVRLRLIFRILGYKPWTIKLCIHLCTLKTTSISSLIAHYVAYLSDTCICLGVVSSFYQKEIRSRPSGSAPTHFEVVRGISTTVCLLSCMLPLRRATSTCHIGCLWHMRSSSSFFFIMHLMNASMIYQFRALEHLAYHVVNTNISNMWRSSTCCSSHAVQPDTICSAVSFCSSQYVKHELGVLFMVPVNPCHYVEYPPLTPVSFITDWEPFFPPSDCSSSHFLGNGLFLFSSFRIIELFFFK